ncbi:MAG: YIP1 family protein [Candidatus Aenigmarchaeota archaeon]|nr:YIP1 family protein [Candidatus Aenigmarchaeota archaeon]
MKFLEKAETILKDPDKFFGRVKSEKKINDAFSFLLVTSLVYFAATIALILTGPLASMGAVGIVSVSVFTWAMSILFVFIMAAIVNIVAKLLGGKGGYLEAYKSLVYGSLPSQVLGWLPFIGFLLSLWSLYIQAKGVSRLYKIGMFRAFVAVISPSMAALALILVFASSLITGKIPITDTGS